MAFTRPDPVVLLEYRKNPQATTDKFVGDWLLTGVLAEGQQPTEALEQEIPEFVKTRLARHEYPRAIEFVDSCPRRPRARSCGGSCASENGRRIIGAVGPSLQRYLTGDLH